MTTFCRPTNILNGLLGLINHFPQETIMAEIGSYAGESAEIFISSGKIKRLYCIDPWQNGYDISDAASEMTPMSRIENIFDERLKRFNNFEKIKMTGDDACRLFANEYFDVVYIDAKHTYEACKFDILNYFPKIKTNGIISGHDYDNGFPGVVKAVDEIFGAPHACFLDTSWMVNKSVFYAHKDYFY